MSRSHLAGRIGNEVADFANQFRLDARAKAVLRRDGGECAGKELTRRAELRAARGPGVENPVGSVALSDDGRVLAAGCGDRAVWVWGTESGRLLRWVRGNKTSVRQVLLLPGGKKGVSMDQDHSGFHYLVWDVEGDAEPTWLHRIDRGEQIIALSADSKLVLGSYGHFISLADGRSVSKLVGTYNLSCHAAVFSPDGNKVAIVSSGIQLWDIAMNKKIWAVPHRGAEGLLFTSDGKRVFSVGDGSLQTWDVENGDELGPYRFDLGRGPRSGQRFTSYRAFTPGRERILLGTNDGSLFLVKLPI
jgi:WD40 repeat protein